MESTYPRVEKLKHKKDIELLFAKGKWITNGKLRLIYLLNTSEKKIGTSVSKKYFKNAEQRNRYKRLLREVYRLNKEHFKEVFGERFHLMLFYISTQKSSLQEVQNLFFEATEKLKKS